MLKLTKKQVLKAIKNEGCSVSYYGGKMYRAYCPWGRIIIEPLDDLYYTIFGTPIKLI